MLKITWNTYNNDGKIMFGIGRCKFYDFWIESDNLSNSREEFAKILSDKIKKELSKVDCCFTVFYDDGFVSIQGPKWHKTNEIDFYDYILQDCVYGKFNNRLQRTWLPRKKQPCYRWSSL
jgi:hypothetical protein